MNTFSLINQLVQTTKCFSLRICHQSEVIVLHLEKALKDAISAIK